jgi:4-hydroxybenzoate polyprenyltransferase
VLSTVIFLVNGNSWPAYLAIPILVFLWLYSLSKRFTVMAHFWLGTSLMLAPLAAWIAIRGMTELMTPLVLGVGVLFWVAGFDIIYACQDAEFDRGARLLSLPAKYGVAYSLRFAALCHLVTVIMLAALPLVCDALGRIYLGGVAGVGLLLLYEHSLVRPGDLKRVNQAFFMVNGIISIGMLMVVAIQLAFNE